MLPLYFTISFTRKSHLSLSWITRIDPIILYRVGYFSLNGIEVLFLTRVYQKLTYHSRTTETYRTVIMTTCCHGWYFSRCPFPCSRGRVSPGALFLWRPILYKCPIDSWFWVGITSKIVSESWSNRTNTSRAVSLLTRLYGALPFRGPREG
jgi:hypothetical protein